MIQADLYFDEILQFLRTLTIKNAWFAFQYLDNYARSLRLTTSQVSPFANPYYQGLCGFYTNGEDPIVLPNGATLTSEYAEDHQYVINRLQLPNKAYDNLCREYPEQVDLIKSILYPIVVTDDEMSFVENNLIVGDTVMFTDPNLINIANSTWSEDDMLERATIPVALTSLGDDASGLTSTQLLKRATKMYKVITADDMSVVTYDELLLEKWERDSVINAINEFLAHVKRRWYVKEFNHEDLYTAAMWSTIWYQLVLVVHTQRILNIRTPSVHSYHIWEYLRGHGFGNFSRVLDRDQQMYLYRNLRYLFANKGKSLVLKELSDHLLEPNGVEVFGKLMLMDTSDSLENCMKEPYFISTSVGGDETPTQRLQAKDNTLSEMLNWENLSGLEPLDELPWIEGEQGSILRNTPETVYRTKLIEFDRTPRYAGYEELFMEFYMGSFLHEWNAGRLENMRIEFSPSYYDQTLVLKATDVVYLLCYAALKLTGQVPGDLPTSFNVNYALRTAINTDAYEYTCDVTKNSRVLVPDDTDFSSIFPGMTVSGTGIPDNCIVTSLENDHIVISHAATADGVGVTITLQDVPEIEPAQIGTYYNWFKTSPTDPDSIENLDVKHSTYNVFNDTVDSVLYPFLPAQNTASADDILGYRYDNVDVFDEDKNNQFEGAYTMLLGMRGTSDVLHYSAFKEIFVNHLTMRYTFSKEPPEDFTTFDDWIAGDSRLNGLIELHNTTTDRNITWALLLDQMMKRVLPIKNSPFVGLGVFSDQEYEQLVQIITKICSYNIAFLTKNTDAVSKWLRLAYTGTVSQNRIFGHEPMIPMPLAMVKNSSVLAKETRIGVIGPLGLYTYSYSHSTTEEGEPVVTEETFGHSQYMDALLEESQDHLSEDVDTYIQ
jgi:hypothetical protein